MAERPNRVTGELRWLTLRDLLALEDAGVIQGHVVGRIERGDVFAAGLCWCGRARDDHPTFVAPGDSGADHEVAQSGTRSLHRLLGLGQEPLPHAAEMHSDALREACVRCRMDRWWVGQTSAAGGHRDLRVGDFGWWHCRACGRRGDDWSDPADYPCEPQGGVDDC